MDSHGVVSLSNSPPSINYLGKFGTQKNNNTIIVTFNKRITFLNTISEKTLYQDKVDHKHALGIL